MKSLIWWLLAIICVVRAGDQTLWDILQSEKQQYSIFSSCVESLPSLKSNLESKDSNWILLAPNDDALRTLMDKYHQYDICDKIATNTILYHLIPVTQDMEAKTLRNVKAWIAGLVAMPLVSAQLELPFQFGQVYKTAMERIQPNGRYLLKVMDSHHCHEFMGISDKYLSDVVYIGVEGSFVPISNTIPSFTGVNGQIISVDGLISINNLMDVLHRDMFYPDKTIPFPLLAHSKLDLWYELLSTAGLDGMVRAEPDILLFAPVREAFEKAFGEKMLAYLKSPLGKPVLIRILMYHMAFSQTFYGQDVPLDGNELSIFPVWPSDPYFKRRQGYPVRYIKGKIMVKNAKVVYADWLGNNGVIHVIDKVLLPECGVGKKSFRLDSLEILEICFPA